MTILCMILAVHTVHSTYPPSPVRARSPNRPTRRGLSRGNELIVFSGRLPSDLGPEQGTVNKGQWTGQIG